MSYSLEKFQLGLESLNIQLTEKQIEQFIKFYELLVEKNLAPKEDFIYTPHVTLCRNAKLLVPSVDLSRGIHIDKKTLIDNITLYESTNINGVLTYQPLYIREV